MKPTNQFVELNKTIHERQSFECGEQELSNFLKQFAAKHRKAGISKTMILPAEAEPGIAALICAYYTLSHTEIKRETLPAAMAKKLPCYPVPVMLLAQMAVHKDCQGQGLGEVTLIKALEDALNINKHLPSFAVVVDALGNDVQAFYEQYGFQVLGAHNGRVRLFLAMATAEQLFT